MIFRKILLLCLCICLSSNMPLCYAEQSGSEAAKIQEAANDAFWHKDFAGAKCDLLKLANSGVSSGLKVEAKARLLVNLSLCNAQLDNWDQALIESSEAVKYAEPDSMDKADALLALARCLNVGRKAKAARSAYEQALAIANKKLGQWNPDLAPFYEGLAACESNDKNLPEAERLYFKVAQLDYLKYGADSTYLGWSLLSLSVILQAAGNEELARLLYKKVFWNFRHQNEKRILSEIKPESDEQQKIVTELRRQLYGFNDGYADRSQGLEYITKDIPSQALKESPCRAHDFNNWFPERIGRERAPGLAFFDPRTKLKGLILAVHGLGLHQGAYTPFAKKIQHEGYGVVSFDVRGFGSYRNDEVYQQVDYKAIIGDLQRILTALRRDYPGLPIFILGESMGGAIALRIAALSPGLVDGVVSSVPSGTRFQARSTAVKVAVRFLKNRQKQFNIGEGVVNQATKDPKLRLAWEDDPDARMKFSASDLLAFQKFMNDNLKYAEQIRTTPVIIFQGYSDQLVKPLGTLALYQAISAKDKDLIFVGHAEHLIFEEGQFDQDTVDGLVGWLNKRVARLPKP